MPFNAQILTSALTMAVLHQRREVLLCNESCFSLLSNCYCVLLQCWVTLLLHSFEGYKISYGIMTHLLEQYITTKIHLTYKMGCGRWLVWWWWYIILLVDSLIASSPLNASFYNIIRPGDLSASRGKCNLCFSACNTTKSILSIEKSVFLHFTSLTNGSKLP